MAATSHLELIQHAGQLLAALLDLTQDGHLLLLKVLAQRRNAVLYCSDAANIP